MNVNKSGQDDRALGLLTPIFIDCAKLARSAEWWGSPPQSSALAELAQHIADKDIVAAMWVRDDILDARNDARTKKMKLLLMASARLVRLPVWAIQSLFEKVTNGLVEGWKLVSPLLAEVAFLIFILGVVWFSKFH